MKVRRYITREELERLFGGEVSFGNSAIFVNGGGDGELGDWTTWRGDKAIGTILKRKKKED